MLGLLGMVAVFVAVVVHMAVQPDNWPEGCEVDHA